MADEHMLLGFLNATARSADRMADNGRAASPRPATEAAACRQHARVWHVVIRRGIRRAACLLRLWRRRMAEADELRSISDRELRDFGVNLYEAEFEARKAFWRQW